MAALVPTNEVLNNLGAAQSRRNLPESIESFRKAMEGDESDPAYQFNLGYALWKQGKFEPAADRFRAVLERKPDDSDAKLLLSPCHQPAGTAAGRNTHRKHGTPQDQL